MAINYVWTFPTLFVKLTDGDLQNVVKSISWGCMGTDEDTLTNSDISGTVDIGLPDPGSFIEYNMLTFDDIAGWVSFYLDVPAIESEISDIISSKMNSNIVPMDPPF